MPNPTLHTPSLPPAARPVFQGEIFTVYQWDQEMYDGTTAVFERITRADTVGVLPILPSGKVILSRQEQPAHKPFTGAIGGVVDPGETPLQAAQRELLEEAGYTTSAEHWHHLFSVVPYEKIQWAMHIFIAKQCVQTAPQQLDRGEKIEVFTVRPNELLETFLEPTWRDHLLTHYFLRAHYRTEYWQELMHQLQP